MTRRPPNSQDAVSESGRGTTSTPEESSASVFVHLGMNSEAHSANPLKRVKEKK